MSAREKLNISLPYGLKDQVTGKRSPLPEGITWSNVFQVMLMTSRAVKKKTSDHDFKKELMKDEKYVKVRQWIRDNYQDWINED